MTENINWDDYPNFERHEFECQCGCGQAPMDPLFMARLQSLRTLLATPFAISSGYRCPDHNARVSSTGRTGPHTTGKAADIAVMRTVAHKVLTQAFQMFPRIGVNQKGKGRFVHVDSVEGPPTVWSY